MPDFTTSPVDLIPEKRDSPACSKLSAITPSSSYFALGPIPWGDLLPAHLLGCHLFWSCWWATPASGTHESFSCLGKNDWKVSAGFEAGWPQRVSINPWRMGNTWLGWRSTQPTQSQLVLLWIDPSQYLLSRIEDEWRGVPQLSVLCPTHRLHSECLQHQFKQEWWVTATWLQMFAEREPPDTRKCS